MEGIQSLSSEKFTYLYVDTEGTLQFDHDDSFCGKVTRFVMSLLGQRDYDLASVFPLAQKQLDTKDVQFLTTKLAKKAGLKQGELESIQTMSRRFFSGAEKLTSEEVEDVKSLVKKSGKSDRIGKAARKIQEMGVTIDHVHAKALEMVATLSEEVRPGKKLGRSFDKVEDLSGKLQSDGTLSEPMKKKLSLKEMASLEKVAKLAPVFRELTAMGVTFDRESSIGKLRRRVNITENTLNRVHNLIDKDHKGNAIQFIFYDLKNFQATKPSDLNPIVPFIFRHFLKTDISHASFSFMDSKSRETENHVMGELTQSRRTLTSHPYKTYTPNMNKLFFNFPQKVQSQMKQFYGPDWKEVLGRKYLAIASELFQNPTYEDLPRSAINRFISSLGLGCMLSEGPIQKRMRVKEYKGCICAEFVMKSLRQAFMKLEKEVQQDFALRAKRQGIELTEPKLPNFLSDEQVAAAKSPAGMARTLREDGLVTERAQPKLLGEILDYRTYDMDEALSL